MDTGHRPDRRTALARLATLACGAALPATGHAAPGPILERAIPASGEQIPAVGMGTWLTFDVAPGAEREARLGVLHEFFTGGGALLDSSPMYGYAEAVLGEQVPRLRPARVFNATKVWTPTRFLGVRQMEESFAHWRVKRFDLMQVHNMLDWETHLVTLKDWKRRGRIRYIGITTSHGRRHDDLAEAMQRERFDFVQFSYSFADRDAEKVLLPLAAETGRGRHRQPPVRRRRSLRRGQGQAPARVGARDRLCQLGAGVPQVRDLASRGHLRDPRHEQPGAHAREHRGPARADARCGPAAAHGRRLRPPLALTLGKLRLPEGTGTGDSSRLCPESRS